MRIRTALIFSLVTVCGTLAVAPVAHSQSFFQKLFGANTQPNVQPLPAPRLRAVIPQHRFQSRAWHRSFQSRRPVIDDADESIGPPDSGGPYKTVCVRACDGFYFPLRHNARRKNFASDVKSCRNACGTQGKLYYYPLRDDQGPDTMVDLEGRKYAESATAFAYRKKLVGGCACKPDPWSYEEARRHQSYADQQALELAEASEDATPATDETPVDVATTGGEDATPAPSDESFAAGAFSDASNASSSTQGSVDLTSEVSAVVGKTDDRDGAIQDLQSEAPSGVTARPERPLSNRIWRRRSPPFLHRTTYGLVPTHGRPSRHVMP